jgi:hypothetical protein
MIEKICEGERLLEIDNLHSAECGAPPSLDAADKYVGYFENGFGEQWMFIGDRKTGEAVIRGGDAGWATEFNLSLKNPCPPTLVLNDAEKHWIITCFMAMSNAPYGAVAADFAGGDFLAAVLSISTALDKGPSAKPADHQGKNGSNGNQAKDGRPEG